MSYLFSLLFAFLLVTFLSVPTYADSKPVINEFLPHPSSGGKEWVEFSVPDGMSLAGYWVDDDTDFTDDTGNSRKRQITTVVQGSDARHVVYELSSAMFNNGGDTVTLFDPNGVLLDTYTYYSDPGINVSIGRSPDETGDFHILAYATRGSPNSIPKPTSTPTPAPTQKPTKVPKPTATPKPVKSSYVTSFPVSIETHRVLADAVSKVNQQPSLSPSNVSSKGAYPTSILSAKTKSVKKKKPKLPDQNVMVQGVSSTEPQMIAVIIGGVLLISCGILLYWKKKTVTS